MRTRRAAYWTIAVAALAAFSLPSRGEGTGCQGEAVQHFFENREIRDLLNNADSGLTEFLSEFSYCEHTFPFKSVDPIFRGPGGSPVFVPYLIEIDVTVREGEITGCINWAVHTTSLMWRAHCYRENVLEYRE